MSSGYILLRSLTKSQDIPVKASVKGKIPEWLNGSLFRNGPGRFKFGDKTYKHLFDGQACVHKYKIKDKEVEYSNKLLETKSYLRTLNENLISPTFGTVDKTSNVFKRVKEFFLSSETKDNVGVTVFPFANKQLYALTETNLICQLDPNDMSIKKTVNMKDYFDGIAKTIAHPHFDSDGSWINAGFNARKKTYEFIKFDSSAKSGKFEDIGESGKIIASIPSSYKDGACYFHHFGITQNYIIFLEQSLLINFKKMLYYTIMNKPISEALSMNPEWNTRVRIINKHTGQESKQKFITEPLFTFHHINAYEKVDPNNPNKIEIMVDACIYDPKTFDINSFQYEYMFTGKILGTDTMKALAKRIIVPLDLSCTQNDKEIYCKTKFLNSEHAIELPMINYERFNGLPYKYYYSVGHYKKPFSIIKMNADDEKYVLKKIYHDDGVNYLPTEPVFVENPNPKSEDDGVLLVMVLSDKNDFLSVLDAKDLSEIARAEIPENVKGALTFHGFFADQNKMKALNL